MIVYLVEGVDRYDVCWKEVAFHSRDTAVQYVAKQESDPPRPNEWYDHLTYEIREIAVYE